MSFDPQAVALVAVSLMTAMQTGDQATCRRILADLEPDETRGVVWALLGAHTSFAAFMVDVVGPDEFVAIWQRAAAEIAAT